MRFLACMNGKEYELELLRRDTAVECRIDGRQVDADVVATSQGTLSILYEGKSYEVRRGNNRTVEVNGHTYEILLTDTRSWQSRHQTRPGLAGPQRLSASMPGKVVRILAEAGAQIQAGEGIVVIEAMKMQNEVRAPRAGTLASIPVKEGQAVNAGEVLAIIE